MHWSMVNWRGIMMGSKSGAKYTHRCNWGCMRSMGRSMSGSKSGSKNSNRSYGGNMGCMGGSVSGSWLRYWGMSMVMLETELGGATVVRGKCCHMGYHSRAGGSDMDRVYHSWCRLINWSWVVHRSGL